eukprot:3843491-Rhodomonas_salina.1
MIHTRRSCRPDTCTPHPQDSRRTVCIRTGRSRRRTRGFLKGRPAVECHQRGQSRRSHSTRIGR